MSLKRMVRKSRLESVLTQQDCSCGRNDGPPVKSPRERNY
jgi:hypothetical protein